MEKKNETLSLAGKWMELEIIMLSKINHAQKELTMQALYHLSHTPSPFSWGVF
jgi:hypothetical protein